MICLSNLAQKVSRTPGFSWTDGPLGSAQVQSGILTCIAFPKATTEVLRESQNCHGTEVTPWEYLGVQQHPLTQQYTLKHVISQ